MQENHQPREIRTYEHMARIVETVIAPWAREQQITAVYGMPRKGMTAAAMLANVLDCALGGLDASGTPIILAHGTTHPCCNIGKASLLLDESVFTGQKLFARSKQFANNFTNQHDVFTGTVFECRASHVKLNPNLCLDIVGETIDIDRVVFPWDMWQHEETAYYMCDFDGVLCPDRDAVAIQDKTPEYVAWCQSAPPIRAIPHGIHSVCTWRESYMAETSRWWLGVHGIKTTQDINGSGLICATRQNWASPASYKAKIYMESDARLFVESDPQEAREMRRLLLHSLTRTTQAGSKPVYCVADGTLA